MYVLGYPVPIKKNTYLFFNFRLDLQRVFLVLIRMFQIHLYPFTCANWLKKGTKGLCQIPLFYSKKNYTKLLNLVLWLKYLKKIEKCLINTRHQVSFSLRVSFIIFFLLILYLFEYFKKVIGVNFSVRSVISFPAK